MNKKIIILTCLLILIVILGLIVGGKIKNSKKSSQQIDMASSQVSQLAPVQNITLTDVAKSKDPISANDILKNLKEPFDCGQECKDESCSEIKDCLKKHSEDCSIAYGKVIYPIINSDRKKEIEHIIAGKDGDKCIYEGVTTGTGANLNTKANHKYSCSILTYKFEELFASEDPVQFIMDNCKGSYVDFLKSKRSESGN